MQNSRISSTVSDSNIHWDCLQAIAANTFGGAGSATVQPTPTIFPRSKALVRNVTNPNTNEGIVHLIRQIHTRAFLQVAELVIGRHSTTFQIRRRPDVGTPEVLTGNVPVEEVAYEDTKVGPDQIRAFGVAGQISTDVNDGSDVNFDEYPLVMVRPYSLDFLSTISVPAAANTTVVVIMYLFVESIRVKGEKYRRLLDHYTQMSGNPRGTA